MRPPNDREFVERFAEVTGGRRPTGYVEGWEQFVGFCEEGYHDILDEYWFDLSVRDAIERVLTDERLFGFPQMGWVRERIESADDRFRAVLSEQPMPGSPSVRGGRRTRRPGRGRSSRRNCGTPTASTSRYARAE